MLILKWCKHQDINQLKNEFFMKKSISIILLASSLLFILLSCNDNDDNYVPEAYRKILSLKESGIKDYSMNANQSSITENILILKGGGGTKL